MKLSSLSKPTLLFSTFNSFNYSFAFCLPAPTHFVVSNRDCKQAPLYDPPSCLIGTNPLNNFPECHRKEGMCHACLGVRRAPKANVSESHTFSDRKIFGPMKNVTCLLFCRQGSIGLNILCGDDAPATLHGSKIVRAECNEQPGKHSSV